MAGCRSLNDTEINEIKNKLELTRNKLLFVLGLKTGLRITELLSITMGDIIANGIIGDRVKIRRANMKGKLAGREVIIHDEVKEVLKEYVKEIGSFTDDTPLFESPQNLGKAISRKTAWQVLKEAYAEAGALGQTGCHSMRKTHAMKVYEQSGYNILLTQKCLGHTSLQNTVKYLDIEQSMVDEIVKKLK